MLTGERGTPRANGGPSGARTSHRTVHPHSSNAGSAAASLTLRPYQQEALKAIEDAARYGVQRPLLDLPTGSGKTPLFVEAIRRRPGRALVLAHRDVLITQAADKFRMFYPSAELGIVKAERDEHDAPIVLASVQTLARPQRLARIQPDFTTVVVDEAHHSTADTYRRILEHVGSFKDGGTFTFGVTATPERGDGQGLDDVWSTVVYSKTIIDLICEGYLCDLRAIQVRLDVDFSGLHVRRGDFIEAEVEELFDSANAPQHVVAAYHEHAAGRKALIFTPTVKVAHEMAEAFRESGVAAEALDAKTPRKERRAILARFRSGETQAVANCAVLTEGFDEPSADCIILARPTKSRPFYKQMVGRGTRTYPGKSDCLVLDVVGATTRHDLVTTATLFGLGEPELEERTVGEAVAQREEQEQRIEHRGKLVAQAVDLFKRQTLAWTATSGGRFSLSTGKSLLVLSLEGAGWSVRELVRGQDGRTLAQGLDLGYAQGVAEDRARQLGAGALLDRTAPWRQRPASDKQRLALRRWRIPPEPGLSAGEASDLIGAAIAGARR